MVVFPEHTVILWKPARWADVSALAQSSHVPKISNESIHSFGSYLSTVEQTKVDYLFALIKMFSLYQSYFSHRGNWLCTSLFPFYNKAPAQVATFPAIPET